MVAAGHPLITVALRDVYDLGGEFFRWELATAVAGQILGVNPFDEPNVAESKENTGRLLDHYRRKRRLPEDDPTAEEGMISLYDGPPGGEDLADTLAPVPAYRAARGLHRHPGLCQPDRPRRWTLLDEVRTTLRDESTGGDHAGLRPALSPLHRPVPQGRPDHRRLHPDHRRRSARSRKIPDEDYSFATLIRAQALGDLEALRAHDRRVVRLHLAEAEEGLEQFAD